MPKLSKSRIINLNYNDGKRTIYNEIFDYADGKNTLFSMDNGIGKTVLIQFFMQPFTRNKRDLADRKFEEYFTGNAPTYIMHEILLDNGEKLLAGMVIKKDSSEEEKNKLRILAFLNKYSRPNDFDIINIPFVEGRRILKFSEAEEKIKNYSRGKLNFKYFNFNDSSKKAEYFTELKLHKIDYKEWEDIIRSINNDESGLSNLYDKHKTDEALIRNVIIPLIESKINGEKNVIEAIRNNLSKYIESFKLSKESFREVALLKDFQSEMLPVLELLEQGVQKEEERDRLYRRLYSIALLCEEEFSKKSSEKRQCEEFIEELRNELLKVSYEEHSLNFYNFLGNEQELEEKLEEAEAAYGTENSKLSGLKREKYIQESAEIYEDFLEAESNLTEVRERIANYEKEDSEIARNIRNYKFTLKKIYEEELEELNKKDSEYKETDAALRKSIEENANKQGAVREEITAKIKAEAEAKNKISNFEKIESHFKVRYKDFEIERNPLLNEYNSKELEKYSLKIEENINSAVEGKEKYLEEEASLSAERADLKEKAENTGREINEQQLALAKKKMDLELFNKETAKILEILSIKNLPINVALYKEKLSEVLHSEMSRLQEKLSEEQNKLRETEDTINRYETGLITLPKEVLQSFENKGISFEYALNFLKNYQGSKEEKENLVANNPFFPYGILLSDKDIALLKKESIDVYTSIPIPIINRSQLNKKINTDKSNDILTIENQEFLLAFNYLLIDEEERLALLRELKQKAEGFNEDILNINASIDRNKEYIIKLNNYSYAGTEGEVLEEEISEIEKKAEALDGLLQKYKDKILKNEKRKEEITKAVQELEKSQRNLKEQRESFKEFLQEHEEFKKYNNELFNLKKEADQLKKKEEEFVKDRSELQSKLMELTVSIRELRKDIKDTSDRVEIYRNIDTGTLCDEDKNILEAKLKASEQQLGENIKRDKEDEKKFLENLNKTRERLSRTVKEGELSEEYKAVSFDSSRLENIKSEINSEEQLLKALEEKKNKLDKELTLIIDKKQREVKDIERLGFEGPIQKEDIKDSNFAEREKRIKEDLKENNIIIEDYIKTIDKLKLLKQKLDIYKTYSVYYKENEEKVSFDFNDLDEAIRAVNDYINTYDTVKKEVYNIEASISKSVNVLHDRYRDKNRFIKERLFDFLNKERKISNHSDIESLLEVVDRRIRTMELELSSIKSEEEVVLNEILRYANNLLQELKTIDKKSTIKHLGKTQKMLEISIPEEKEEEALKEYIKGRAVYFSEFEGDYSKQLEVDIQSAELLSKLIGNINRIRVDIKKIEKTGLVRKSWKDALSQNSGGEKFVSMFILLSSLMSYMRKRETDIDNKEEKKILIMDNPFAKMNAAHLVEPMFQIAEKYNIQLICFSGIGGSSVYNSFDRIYVAKVIEDKFRNKENVSFKVSGNEETLELTDFTISKEQISMF